MGMDKRMRQLTLMGLLGAMISICGAMMYIELVSMYPALAGSILPAFGFGALSLGSVSSAIIWALR